MAESDHSYGIIPVFTRDAKILYLVVKKATGAWGFPKGHKNVGEDAVDAALRELKEETGIKLDRSIIAPDMISEHYTFLRDGVAYDKTVDYWIGRVPSMELEIDKNEIVDYAWLPFDQALERITFTESKQVAKQAQAVLLAKAQYQ